MKRARTLLAVGSLVVGAGTAAAAVSPNEVAAKSLQLRLDDRIHRSRADIFNRQEAEADAVDRRDLRVVIPRGRQRGIQSRPIFWTPDYDLGGDGKRHTWPINRVRDSPCLLAVSLPT